MANLIQKRFCVQILMQSLHKSRRFSMSRVRVQGILHHPMDSYPRSFVSGYTNWLSPGWFSAQRTQVLASSNLKRLISSYPDSQQGKISSRKSDGATHHAGKLQLDFDEEEDLRQLLEDARQLLDTDDFKMVKTDHAQDKVEHLVKYLCYSQCSPENILHVLERNPQILTPAWSSLREIILLLEEIGLRRGQLLKALDGHKALWEANVATLRKCISQLWQMGFSDDLRKVVAKWPQILTIQNKQVNRVIEELKQCDFSREEIKTIVADHPQVLIDSPADIALKLQYVHFCMGITDGGDLVHGKIFKYSLDHIRTRHILLERMGFFRTPDNYKIRSAKNPLLSMIIDTTDRRFCSKVAGGISVEDLEIFRENLKDELEEMGLLSRDSSDSNEDDSDVSSDEDNGYESDESEEYSDSDEENPDRGYRR